MYFQGEQSLYMNIALYCQKNMLEAVCLLAMKDLY